MGERDMRQKEEAARLAMLKEDDARVAQQEVTCAEHKAYAVGLGHRVRDKDEEKAAWGGDQAAQTTGPHDTSIDLNQRLGAIHNHIDYLQDQAADFQKIKEISEQYPGVVKLVQLLMKHRLY